MTRFGWLALIFLFILQVRGMAAADLIEKVSAGSRAHLHTLDKYGMLPSSRASLFGGDAERLMTRYDIAFALIEPLRLFIAYTEPPVAKDNSEQRRLREQAMRVMRNLSPDEKAQLLSVASQLLTSFADVIEKLSPGLPAQAKDALQQIRRWNLKGAISSRGDSHPVITISVDPNAESDAMGNPLPLLPFHRSDMEPKPFISENDSGYRVGPANSVEAMLNIVYKRFQLSGKISTLPGQEFSTIRPDKLSGSAMVRLQCLLGQINDNLSIGGIVEYHILRSCEDTGTSNTRTGGMVGAIILW